MRATATRLREEREAAGLTQAELARAAGTSQPAVNRYERGVVTPSPHTLGRLMAACSRSRRPREILLRHRDEVLAILRGYGASIVLVFGSVARGEDDADSDIDLLVDRFDKDAYVWAEPKAKDDLEKLLGVKVDVGEVENMRKRVLVEALHEACAL
jgi:predicted nucleotidyltransferase/DNA-binding XRE family transcriptional regulator